MARHDPLSRLDAVLVDRGLVPTRAQAQAAVLAGEVYVDGALVTKAGALVAPDALIELRTRRPSFVSRGGLKLDHALTAFGLDVGGLRAVDVGSSTGGFTDCLLKRGAAHVHAVDVGTGQLAWELRTDPRVTVLERRDVRGVTPEELGGAVDLAVVDVAFIGLGKIMPVLRALVRSGGTVVALVKPQFEAGPRGGERGGGRGAGGGGERLAPAHCCALAAGRTGGEYRVLLPSRGRPRTGGLGGHRRNRPHGARARPPAWSPPRGRGHPLTPLGVLVNTTRLREHREMAAPARAAIDALLHHTEAVWVNEEAAGMLDVARLGRPEEEVAGP